MYHGRLRSRAKRCYTEESDEEDENGGDDFQPGPSSRARGSKKRRLNETGARVTVCQPAGKTKGKTNGRPFDAPRQQQHVSGGEPEHDRKKDVAASYRILEKANLVVYPSGGPVDIIIRCSNGTCAVNHVVSYLDIASAIIVYSTHLKDKKNNHRQLCAVDGCSIRQTYTSLLRHLFKDHLGLRIRCCFPECLQEPFNRLNHYQRHLKKVHKCAGLLPPDED
ncbi:hypothetical protein OH76DRAFT_287595 [Lentinus brumalis]|uniref:Uncharacterized protein n=1 Tax=Lentinus brumalis TaxID=2498619 RepID=A0A371CKK0_9APHY|nr:hypothetical protein OH76DRAFT_287595 [Polyporus brumalis]